MHIPSFRSVVTIISLLLIPITANANTGVFYGVGSQVIPIKNDNVQLVSENVLITLVIDQQAPSMGIPFFPAADVRAEFILKNTASEAQDLQVGFPFLDLQGFGDEKLALLKLNFRAAEGNSERKVEQKEGLIEKELDPKGLFKKVFAWKEHFGANQTKTIVVSYRLLLGVTSVGSMMREFDESGRKQRDLDKLFPALGYTFGYLTRTAYTWKAPIEKAEFTLDCTALLAEFRKPGLSGRFGLTGKSHFRPIIVQKFLPEGAIDHGESFKWEFSGSVPLDGLSANFIILFIPASAGDLPQFQAEIKTKLGKEIDYKEFLEILRGYYRRILKTPTSDESDFSKKYFEAIHWLTAEPVFSSDHVSIKSALESLD